MVWPNTATSYGHGGGTYICYSMHHEKCDPLRDNPAHPAKIDFLLEAIILTKVLFSENVIIAAMGQQTLGLKDTRV